MPKQFLPLWQGASLFQITLQRLAVDGAAPPLIICNIDHEAEVRRQLAGAGIDGATIILEPERRDSAAAIAVAACWAAANHGADIPIGVFPSDQLIRDQAAFLAALDTAAALARTGRLITFGITPDRPATEFGYIERGAPLEGTGNAFEVESFHEKPNAAVAASYLATGRFDWNSGMFVFTAKGFFDQAERHMGAILSAARRSVEGARPGAAPGVLLLDREAFLTAERNSIDYALFERADGVATVALSCGWNDVGNWRSAHSELPKDADGNVMIGDAKAKDTKDSIIISDRLPVRVLGLEGIGVVASEVGVLVVRLEDAARLKDVLCPPGEHERRRERTDTSKAAEEVIVSTASAWPNKATTDTPAVT
jgi:mannose-1-phosphate guanylyltransferase/mannose-6-phosphate isomerase